MNRKTQRATSEEYKINFDRCYGIDFKSKSFKIINHYKNITKKMTKQRKDLYRVVIKRTSLKEKNQKN